MMSIISALHSHVKWSEVSPIFDNIRRHYVEQVKAIPELDYETLSKMLGLIIKYYYANLFDGKDNKQSVFTSLRQCCGLLPDVTVDIDSGLNGKRVHAHGYFEFVLTRGGKYVCNLEAKEEKFKQGMAHNLLGCEVSAAAAALVRDYVADINQGFFNGR